MYDDAALLAMLLGILFLLGKLAGRHQAHELAGVNYDSWPVLAWFGVDLGLLGVSLAISKEISHTCQLTYGETAILFLALAILVISSWVAYGRFVKRYSNFLGQNKRKVWTDFRSCGWICLSLYCGFLGLGIVVRGLSK